MKSAFGSKRKARKIQVEEDEEEGGISNVSKPFKKSSLRQSLALDDLPQEEIPADGEAEEAHNGPTIGRSNSLFKKKKKKIASRLSFGPGEIISGDAAEALEDDEDFQPKKSALGRRVIDSSALRTSIHGEEDEERPMYSKDYLNELKNSTPTTRPGFEDEEEPGLDPSELEGATIVETENVDVAYIPSEAEIKEKKERRARLAQETQEQDFISFDDTNNTSSLGQLSLLSRKKKEGSRLVREDEDVAEGFDEFVEDGRIALGKKQERAMKRKHRKEIAEQIRHAEGSEDESDDSEAERRAAYEVAQTRKGMDGLHKPTDEAESTVQIPSKITPLPVLSESLGRLQETLKEMEQDMLRRHQKVADLEQEKKEILEREVEVQKLLKQAGEQYASLTADISGAVADPQAAIEAMGKSPIMVDRGLESFGNTPTFRPILQDDVS